MIKDFRSISLHIGDLDASTTEEDLLQFFKGLGEGVVTNVKVVREHTPANTSLRYGYVNFNDKANAERALETLNYTEIKGKACRLTWVQPDPTQRRSQVGNLFVKPIPPDFRTRDLHDLFSKVGAVMSCKISPYKTEKAGVHGYVQFATKELADKAIETFNGKEERGVKLEVVPARAKSDIIHDTVFVKGFSAELTDEELQEEFSKVAPAKKAIVHRDKEKKSKQFGFVTFNNEEDATKAVNEVNEIKGLVVKVSIARTKWEREQYKKKLRQKTRFLNLYVRGFPADFDDAKLRGLFEVFGKITSCVIMKNEVGTSRGFGFCCFEKEEEARNAMGINGKEFENGNSLVVNYSQSQEERRAINIKRIQDMHAQQQQQQQQQQYPYQSGGVGGVGVNAGVGGGGIQGYPYGYPPYAAGATGVNANAAVAAGNYLYQQQQQQRKVVGPGQQQQYMNAAALQQQQQRQQQIQQQQFAQQQQQQQQRYPQQYQQQRGYPQQYQQQQVASYPAQPPAQAYPYGAGVPAGYGQQQISQTQQYPVAATQVQTAVAQQPAQQTSTTASVASQSGQSDSSINKSVVVDMTKLQQLSPDDQKQYLGELIYPRVHNVDAENAGKITGMLLELDVTELVHILEDRNELQAKILEAQNVLLQAVSQQQQQQQNQ